MKHWSSVTDVIGANNGFHFCQYIFNAVDKSSQKALIGTKVRGILFSYPAVKNSLSPQKKAANYISNSIMSPPPKPNVNAMLGML
jgi:hypothetical protein